MATGVQQLFNEAISALNNRDLQKAEQGFRRVLDQDRSHVPALNLLTVVLIGMGRFADAEPVIAKAVTLNQSSDVSFYNYGLIAKNLQKPQLALEQFTKALALNASIPSTWNSRGTAYNELEQYELAVSDFNEAIRIAPNFAEAYTNKGRSLFLLNRDDEALAAYDSALSIKPDLEEAWCGRGNVLANCRRYDEAIAAYSKALSIMPHSAWAWLGQGNVAAALKRYDEAIAAYDKALAIRPELEGAWYGRGYVFSCLKRYDEAITAYLKTLSIKPDFADAWLGQASCYNDLKRHDEALVAFQKAQAINPDIDFLYGAYFHTKMKVCDWSGFTESLAGLKARIAEKKRVTQPHEALGVIDEPDLQLLAAQIYVESKYPPRLAREFGAGEHQNKTKIRVGYYSADFYNHATAYLLAQLFELHDRRKFEIFGFSFSPNTRDKMQERVSGAFDAYFDVADMGSPEIARKSRDLGIDIAIDLKGHTQDARTEIFAEGCAPIQAAYIGYPGTMGIDCIDYAIGDRIVVPEKNRSFFSEKIVYLPNSYQVNDGKRRISEKVFSKQELGLPDQGFVYCCFNNNYKILPAMFDCWMRILHAVEHSVLWLLEDNPIASGNLRKEAQARGIDGSRLIFASRMPLDEHLARHRLADLFLDTLPCNAHTTASDALWAGLPVLTCMGESFAGRVAASLLNATDLPELVTTSLEAYEASAIKLAHDREKLGKIKQQLDVNIRTAPLFDTPLFVRHLEAAYEAMYRRYQAGLPPDHIEIKN